MPPPPIAPYGSIQDADEALRADDGYDERTALFAGGDADTDVGQDDSGKSSAPQAYFNTVTSFIGVGIYTLPYAFSLMGLYSGIVVMVLMGIVGTYVISTMVECIKLTELKWPRGEKMTYTLIGKEAFGRTGVVSVTCAIVLSQMGFCCAYLLFIGDTLHSLFGTFTIPQYVGIILPGVVALAMLRNLQYLTPTSMFANVVFLTAVASLFVYGFRDSWNPSDNQYDFVRSTWPIGFGNAVFTMSGINLAIPIFTSMRVRKQYPSVANLGVSTVTVLYVLVGAFGYIFYGDDVKDNVIKSLPPTLYVSIVNGLLAIQILFTYPLQLYPVSVMAESALGLHNVDVTWRETKKNLVRLVLVGITALLATQIPYFSLMSALVGAFATSMSIFLLPTAIHTRLFWGKIARWKVLLNCLIFLLGVIGAAVSSFFVIVEIIGCLSGNDESGCSS